MVRQHKNCPYFVAEVSWCSPRSGRTSDIDKMLSLDESLTDGMNYIGVAADYGSQSFLFRTEQDARAFKKHVVEGYAANPQYFVIDDDRNVIVGEDQKNLVAWEPRVSIERAESLDNFEMLVTGANAVSAQANPRTF